MVRIRKNRLAWALVLVVALVAVVCLAPGLARAVTADAGTDAVAEGFTDVDLTDASNVNAVSEQDAQSEEPAVENNAETDATAEPDAQLEADTVTGAETDAETQGSEEAVVEAEPTALNAEPLAENNYSGTSEGTGVKWVLAGDSIQISGSGSWNSSDTQALYHSRNSNTWTAGNVTDVTVVTLTSDWGPFQSTRDKVVVIPRTIEADTFLRFDNSILYTLTDYSMGYFGPSRNDTGYNKVTVSIEQVLNNGGVPYVTSGGWVYFSFESSYGHDLGGRDDYRKNQANSYWDKTIESAIDDSDLEDLYSHFPADSYFGYVLKKESGTWHIDGALTTEPPVYVVEVYQNGIQSFLMTNSGESVSYDDFLAQLGTALMADNGSLSLTQREQNSAEVTFQKDGVAYSCTIEPYGIDEVKQDSAIYVNNRDFGYYTVSKDTYYLCQLNISTPVATNGTLTISKQVEGDAANVNEHFEFTLYADLSGPFNVTYQGVSDSDSIGHPNTLNFDGEKATIELCHGESATISLPAGTKVSIVETRTAAAGTTTTAQVDGGEVKEVGSNSDEETDSDFKVTVPTGENTHVAFTNEANLQPQTGISNNIAPMIGLLAVAGVGAAAVIVKRHSGKRGEDAWEE